MKSFFSFLLLFFLCFDSNLFANRNADLYAVNNLHISANSNSTTIAKQNAITLAKQQAVGIVANRISFINGDLLYELKNTDLKNIISTINIYDEKTTNSSYEANFNITINKNILNNFLNTHQIPFIKNNFPSTVLVFTNGNICELENGVEYNKKNDENGFKYTFADTDIDTSFCTGFDCYSHLPLKYNKDTMIMVSTQYLQGDKYKFEFKNKLSNYITEAILSVNDCKDKIAFYAEKSIKSAMLNNGVSNNNNNEVSILMPIYSLNDFLTMRNKLENLNNINKLELSAISFNKVQFKVSYNYNLNTLISTLNQNGLRVKNKNDYLVIQR